MASLSRVISALERHCGFPASRCSTVARRLQEADVIPMGRPGTSPDLSLDDVISLFLALASDEVLHHAARAARVYGALVPGGADLSEAPDTMLRTAREYLRSVVQMAASDDPEDNKAAAIVRLEVVSSWPEVVIYLPGLAVQRFREVGADAATWNGHVRRAVAVSGNAFVRMIREAA